MRIYDTYKDSGISWLGQIPSHWELKTLRNFLIPFSLKGFPELQMLSVTREQGVILRDMERESNHNVIPEDLSGYKVVHRGQFVINKMKSWQGSYGVSKFEGIVSPAYFVYDLNIANKDFFHIALRSRAYIPFFMQFSKGIRVDQWDLSPIALKSIPFVLPTPSEQEAIVAYLDNATAEIDKAIASQQRMVELLQERKQIIINQAVTQGLNPDARLKDTGINWLGLIPAHWEARKLKTICKYDKYSIKTGPFGTQLKGDDLMQNGAVRVYNQKNVIENNFDDVQFYVSKEKARELNSFYTKPQDLLITSRGTIGKCSILPENAPMGLLHPCLIAMRINQKICDLNWAQIFISSSSFFSTNIFLNSNATTIEVIYTDTLKNVVIPLPPLSEQQEIVAYIKREASKVDHALQQTKLKIELLIERKQILINDIVTGKIKVV